LAATRTPLYPAQAKSTPPRLLESCLPQIGRRTLKYRLKRATQIEPDPSKRKLTLEQPQNPAVGVRRNLNVMSDFGPLADAHDWRLSSNELLTSSHLVYASRVSGQRKMTRVLCYSSGITSLCAAALTLFALAPPLNAQESARSLPIFYDPALAAQGFPNPLVKAWIAGHEAIFIVDSGASANVLADWFVEVAGIPASQRPTSPRWPDRWIESVHWRSLRALWCTGNIGNGCIAHLFAHPR
jgi:hypothetical protein